ncbi:MAG: redox-regulated ATPase YchF [Candidatus Aminicenantales bacterium]
MKICIVGLPQSGKSSLFSALTGASTETAASKGADPIAVVKIPDPRLEKLAAIFEPKKKTAASIEFVELQGISTGDPKQTTFSEQFLGKLRTADALLAVVRSFRDPAVPHPRDSIDARRDLAALETEFLLSDLAIVESRSDRLRKQIAAKKSDRDVRELAALEKCKASLDAETPLRRVDLSEDEETLLRGFRFLTRKPLIAVVNLDEDEIRREPEILAPFVDWAAEGRSAAVGLCARLESEIRQLPEQDAPQFRSDFGIGSSALDRLIATAYRMMGLISFFTVGSDEVKAWTVSDGTVATRAAGVIHSDIERGFIRAEVVSYEHFIVHGDIAGCRTDGTLRLEGKTYRVRDGDIINFRFAV